MGWLFDEQLTNTRKDESGNMKDSLSPPWFFKEVGIDYSSEGAAYLPRKEQVSDQYQ